MLAYAPRPDRRRIRPATLALIIAGHAALLGLVMTSKMDLGSPWSPDKTEIKFVPLPTPPEPIPPEPKTQLAPRDSQLDTPPTVVPTPPTPGPVITPIPGPIPNPGPIIGPGVDPVPVPVDPPIASTGPRFKTPESQIRPPYPPGKRELDQEATLRLKLSIDARGRVTAVEPVGRADPAFLAAARRHILRAWRYEPASEGGKAIASSTVVTLKFELD